ncbi:fas-associated protein [Anaeramoeba flamelloides]|uniref:Fas-associated protein n=1 Tax=Anaeramoeba flamelloides TaxID=1746091 RepID=A0AAV7Z4I5_9EUKA|nr:fas-associated protein [Anaeramoeba flamelloides]KAJ6252160.1 fas-associated protein [Anaeramoeba flamelloides]
MEIRSEKEKIISTSKRNDEKIDNIIFDEIEEEKEKLPDNIPKNMEISKKKVTTRKNRRTFFQKLVENTKALFTPFKENKETTFLQEYEESYGQTHLNFYKGTYNQALQAAKEETKFLILYLHSPEHYSTDKFCEKVLSNENILAIANNSYICWGESIKHPAGLLLAGKFNVTTFPFLAIVSKNSQARYQMAKVFEGYTKVSQLLTVLVNTLEENERIMSTQRVKEEERRSSREIREQQDREYLESVAKDGERLRIEKEKEKIEKEKRELELELQRLEKERLSELKKKKIEKKERQKREIEEKRRNLKPEPNPKTEEGVVRLRVIFPDGEKLSRSFSKQWEITTLFDWVDIQENNSIKPEKYYFVKNYPKTTFSEKNKTFEKAGIQNGDSLMIIKK